MSKTVWLVELLLSLLALLCLFAAGCIAVGARWQAEGGRP